MTADLVRRAPHGAPLQRIAYEVLEWDQLSHTRLGFDQVAIAVILDFEDGVPFTLHWRVREPFECLTTSGWTEDDPTPRTRLLDVSQRWDNLLGAQIVDQRVSAHATEWGSQPWSLRLVFDNGCGLVVCLGELTAEGEPTYMPDSLLVTDSRERAVAYRPRAAATNAWGDT